MPELKSNEDIKNESMQEGEKTNERKFFSEASLDEKEDFLRRLNDFRKLSADSGMFPRDTRKGMFKFRDELTSKYKFPKTFNLDILSDDSLSNDELFGLFEKYVATGLTGVQIEGSELAERIEKSREASERVKKALAGLKYKPTAPDEIEKLINPKRLAEIREREVSINYLLSSFSLGQLERKDLSDSRYFTIEELVERKQECVDLLRRVNEEIQNPELLQESLQILYDKYKFQENKLFDVEEKTGRIILKSLDEDTVQDIKDKLNVSIEVYSVYRDRFARVLQESRTGIDPGVIIVSDDRKKLSYQVGLYGGLYYQGGSFCVGSDLAKTGLIALPTVIMPSVLEHEYTHFEDHIFGGGKRNNLDSLIGEINSYFLDEADDFLEQRPNLIFERMKGIINADYLRKNKPKSMSLKEARSKINRAVDVLHKLHSNGFSKEAISSILMQSDKFDDILQWEKVNLEELKKIAGKNKKKQRKSKTNVFY